MSKYAKRRNPKRDDNEKHIIKALRDLGCFVQPLDAIDLLVAYKGTWYVMEVIHCMRSRSNRPPRAMSMSDTVQFPPI